VKSGLKPFSTDEVSGIHDTSSLALSATTRNFVLQLTDFTQAVASVLPVARAPAKWWFNLGCALIWGGLAMLCSRAAFVGAGWL
jgi:hypothetical protein